MYTSGGGGELITGFIFCSQVHVNEPMTGVGGGETFKRNFMVTN